MLLNFRFAVNIPQVGRIRRRALLGKQTIAGLSLALTLSSNQAAQSLFGKPSILVCVQNLGAIESVRRLLTKKSSLASFIKAETFTLVATN